MEVSTQNIYEVGSAWSYWNEDAHQIFNISYGNSYHFNDVAKWNGAFMAACEASGLNIEYEPRNT